MWRCWMIIKALATGKTIWQVRKGAPRFNVQKNANGTTQAAYNKEDAFPLAYSVAFWRAIRGRPTGAHYE